MSQPRQFSCRTISRSGKNAWVELVAQEGTSFKETKKLRLKVGIESIQANGINPFERTAPSYWTGQKGTGHDCRGLGHYAKTIPLHHNGASRYDQ